MNPTHTHTPDSTPDVPVKACDDEPGAASGTTTPERARSTSISIISTREPALERVGRLLEPPGAVESLRKEAAAPEQTARRLDPEVTLRLLRGREDGARSGKHQSGTAPFGYVRDYSRRKAARGAKGIPLVIEPGEADVVRLIFRLYLRHRSMKKVIDLLHAKGLRTRRGKEWSRAGISWILKNDTYLGRVHFGAIRTRGEHDAIIAPIVYYKAQKLIRKNDKRGRRARGAVVITVKPAID